MTGSCSWSFFVNQIELRKKSEIRKLKMTINNSYLSSDK